MKICVIYDKKGSCPCFVSVVPNKEVFIREVSLACKNDKNLLYSIYPEDYCLYEIDMSDLIESASFDEFVEFTDFISCEKKECEPHD